ncbi:MAG TPA: TRAP transporter small permease subunit [Burkholderiales bacterium]|nr:TRAP transporter small permease subunit [Burkholderiales bacterium]
MLERVHHRYEKLLEAIVFVLMVMLAVIVAAAVIFRKAGASLVWYDEVAEIMLAWVTYYGAALAALRGAHIGVSALVDAMPARMRVAAVVAAEILVIGFFVLLAWAGWHVLEVLAQDTLVSLPEIPSSYAQSPIVIGSVLYVIAELLRLPQVLRAAATPPPGN